MNKIILIIAMLAILLVSVAAECTSNYVCGKWSSCIDTFQSRVCKDISCNRRDIVERRVCTDLEKLSNATFPKITWAYAEAPITTETCIPKIQCSEWSQCVYREKTVNLVKGQISFGGHRERTCEDIANCVKPFSEKISCEDSAPIDFEKMEEYGTQFLVALSPETQTPVAKINLDSWKSKKLDILFTQSNLSYPPECFNAILDENEENIDCGGQCKPCKNPPFKLPQNLAAGFLWLISVTLIISFIKEFKILKSQIQKQTINIQRGYFRKFVE